MSNDPTNPTEEEQPSWYVRCSVPLVNRSGFMALTVVIMNENYLERIRKYFDNPDEAFRFAEQIADIDRVITVERVVPFSSTHRYAMFTLKWAESKWLEFTLGAWLTYKESDAEFTEEMRSVWAQFGNDHFVEFYFSGRGGLEQKLSLE